MISCSPRIASQQGSSWESVSIHWTDTNTKSFEPVDGLPWLRWTEDARKFNMNGPLRVVAEYRTTDNLASKTTYRHVSGIASAVEQHVLVKIVMPKSVSATPGPDWPKFRIWAFLQPPIIGHDKKRTQSNGGYVVDDVPRAGWFEAVVDGAKLTATEYDYSKGHTKEPTTRSMAVSGQRDPEQDNVVRFKIRVQVANNESPEELKAKAKRLRAKNQDIALVEAGSYLKVWVRNEDRSWSKKPLDDESEAIVQAMASEDVMQPTGGKDPRRFKNHTWRRSRIAAHKSIYKGANSQDDALLYVGLFSPHLIEKLSGIPDAFKKSHQKGAEPSSQTGKQPSATSPSQTKSPDVHTSTPHEVNLFEWAAAGVLFGVVLLSARQARNRWVKKKYPNAATMPKGPDNPVCKATSLVVDLIGKAQLPELFAAYGVGGTQTLLDVPGTVKRATTQHPDAYKNTLSVYQKLIYFFLQWDDVNVKSDAIDGAIKSALADWEKEQRNGWEVKKDVKLKEWGAKLNGDCYRLELPVFDASIGKRYPPLPQPIPVPVLAWLSWQVGVKLEGALKVQLDLDAKDYSQGSLSIALTPSGEGKLTLEAILRGIWAALADTALDEGKKISKNPVLDLLKQIIELVDLEVVWQFIVTTLLQGKLSYKLSFEGAQSKSVQSQTKYKHEFSFDPLMSATFNMPIRAQLSVFEIKYDVFTGTIFETNGSRGDFLRDVKLFGNEMRWEHSVIWGKQHFEQNCYLAPNKGEKHLVAFLGGGVELRLPILSGTPLAGKCKAGLSYNKSGETISLVDDIECMVVEAAPGQSSQEVAATVSFRWDPGLAKAPPGRVRFWEEIKKDREKVKSFFEHWKDKGTIQVFPSITPPEELEKKPAQKKLSRNSQLEFKWPGGKELEAVFRKTDKKLVFALQVDYYLDSWVWVQVYQKTLLFGGEKGSWRLVKLLGAPGIHGQRTISLSETDAGIKLEHGESYGIRVSMLNDEEFVFIESSEKFAKVG